MPVWHEAPETTLRDALAHVLQDLNHQVQSNPSFDQVVGLSADELVRHATEAIATFVGKRGLNPTDPNALVQLYCLAFVIGVKYGESHVPDSDTELPSGGDS